MFLTFPDNIHSKSEAIEILQKSRCSPSAFRVIEMMHDFMNQKAYEDEFYCVLGQMTDNGDPVNFKQSRV